MTIETRTVAFGPAMPDWGSWGWVGADIERELAKYFHTLSFRGYHEAVRLRPNHATTWMQLAYVLKESGRWDDARSAFEEVIRLAPGSREAKESHEHLQRLAAVIER